MDKKNAEKVLNRMTGTGMFEQEVQNLVNLGYADILDVSKVLMKMNSSWKTLTNII